jgi:hypothetical protein
MTEHADAIAAAEAVLDAFMAAFNARDLPACTRLRTRPGRPRGRGVAGTGGLQMQLEPQSRGLLREHQSQLAAPHHTNGGDRWRRQGGWVWSVLHHGRAAISP